MLRLLEKSRNKSGVHALLLLICFLALGSCGEAPVAHQPKQDPTGEISVAIRMGKVAAANISRAEIVITGSGITGEMKQQLAISGDTIRGIVTGIPAGPAKFTLNGYDASGALTYTGFATATITAGRSVTVPIPVRRVASTVAGKPQLVVKGVRVLRGTNYESLGWTEYGTSGEDSRITGEIENTGDVAAISVRITVTLRDRNGALLGKVSNYSVGTVPAKSSVLFSVIIESVFPSFGDIDSPTAEVAISE